MKCEQLLLMAETSVGVLRDVEGVVESVGTKRRWINVVGKYTTMLAEKVVAMVVTRKTDGVGVNE